MTKATHKKTTVDVIKQQKKNAKRQAGMGRQQASGVSAASAGTQTLVQSSQSSSAGNNSSGALLTAGGTMIGPIAFYPKAIMISSDTIDISSTTDTGFSSRVSITGQTTADDLKQIDGANNAGQILFLQSITGQTITLKHHTGSAGSGNINIPGGADYVMGAQDIVLLQWDTINNAYSNSGGQWTLVSNPAGGGSSLLSSTNTWTGINTFQANVSFTGATTTIGDANTDVCNIYAKMGTDVNMGTYDINTLDRLLFDVNGSDAIGSSDYGIGAEASGGSTVGLIYSTPASKTHKFNIGGTPELTISNSYISAATKRITNVTDPTGAQDAATKAYVDANGGGSGANTSLSNLSSVAVNTDIDMNDNDIIGIAELDLDGQTATIKGVANLNFYHTGRNLTSLGSFSGLHYEVDSSEVHKFSVGGAHELQVSASYIDVSHWNGSSSTAKRITYVATPTVGTDAANKSYVDSNAGGVGLGDANTWTGSNNFQSTLTASGVFETKTTTKLGDGSNDNIEIYGKTDYKNNTVNWTGSIGGVDVAGYINIKIGGTSRKLYFYQ